jgi:hypothetical protein
MPLSLTIARLHQGVFESARHFIRTAFMPLSGILHSALLDRVTGLRHGPQMPGCPVNKGVAKPQAFCHIPALSGCSRTVLGRFTIHVGGQAQRAAGQG